MSADCFEQVTENFPLAVRGRRFAFAPYRHARTGEIRVALFQQNSYGDPALVEDYSMREAPVNVLNEVRFAIRLL